MTGLLDGLAPYRKAIVAALTPGLLALLWALQNGAGISGEEWVIIALSVIAPGTVTYAVPNAAKGTRVGVAPDPER